MTLNPAGQYDDDRNLRARQRFWEHQDPYLDTADWVLSLIDLAPGMRVLDAGCGNGVYLRALAGREVRAAVRELRRVLAPGGVCVAVTNGARELLSLRRLTEQAVSQVTPGWRMRRATHAFTAENAAPQLGAAFSSVTCVRPASMPPVVIRDPALAADFVASWASFYQHETARPWADVVADVRAQVQAIVDREGAFITSGDLATFICRQTCA